MKVLEALDAQNVGLRGYITEEVMTCAGIGGGNEHVDGFSDLLGDATDGLVVEGVTHGGRRVGTG